MLYKCGPSDVFILTRCDLYELVFDMCQTEKLSLSRFVITACIDGGFIY